MKSSRVTRNGFAVVAFVALFACQNGADPASSRKDGLVCPMCTKGGETSDFGQFAEPTPCELSETATPIDRQTASELGFGSVLGQLERCFESPFQWAPDESINDGAPASGYAPSTSVRVQTTIATIEHVVPALQGCEDSLGTSLHVSFVTGDGAIAIEGEIRVSAKRGEEAPFGFGKLDLLGARGSLELHPSPSDEALVGRLALDASFWPEAVRGSVYIYLTDAASDNADTSTFYYRPLDGCWPNMDECSYNQQLVPPKEPNGMADGCSVTPP